MLFAVAASEIGAGRFELDFLFFTNDRTKLPNTIVTAGSRIFFSFYSNLN